MTAYRRSTPDVDAAQFLPTAEQPYTFSDSPEWLEDALETRRLVVRPQADDDLPALALQAHLGVELVAPHDWIIRDRWGNLHRISAPDFARDYEPFVAAGTTAASSPDGGVAA